MMNDAADREWTAWKAMCVEFTETTGQDCNDPKFRRLFKVLLPDWADKHHTLMNENEQEGKPNGEEE